MNIGNGLLVNLRVISSVQQHERLSSIDGEGVDVCRQGVFQGLRRWLRGEDRYCNLNSVELILKDAFDVINTFVGRAEVADEVHKADLNWLRRIRRGLRDAMSGLDSLKATYEGDLRTIARIDTFKESVHEHLEKLDPWVAEVPELKY